MNLQAGDVFCVRTNTLIARLIILKEKIFALDEKAEYNHAGIILNDKGDTFESLHRINHYNLERYKGCKIIIARYKQMTPERFMAGMRGVEKYDGRIYPFWRLPLHMLGIAKLFRATYPVCSELVGEMLNHAGLHSGEGWGWNPDDLSDQWIISKHVDVLYEGEWNGL